MENIISFSLEDTRKLIWEIEEIEVLNPEIMNRIREGIQRDFSKVMKNEAEKQRKKALDQKRFFESPEFLYTKYGL